MRTILAPALAFLGFAGAAAAETGPSSDCAAAQGEVETLICGNAELAELDRETARLYALALDGPHMTEARRDAELVPFQRGWIKGRNDCWKDADVAACVKREYVVRIAELRQGYADARAGEGISIGPLVGECPGLDALLTVTFVNSDPGAVYLAWRDRVAVLDRAPSGSGARYQAALDDGDYLFWNKGDEATFEAPGVSGPLTCSLGPGG
jgi:uncharacterized protein